jgi:hypothetical protein
VTVFSQIPWLSFSERKIQLKIEVHGLFMVRLVTVQGLFVMDLAVVHLLFVVRSVILGLFVIRLATLRAANNILTFKASSLYAPLHSGSPHCRSTC